MIVDLEALAIRRAAEQLGRPSSYRRRDPDEPAKVEEPRRCPVCEERPPRSAAAKLCQACSDAGWTASRCACGLPLSRADQTAKGAMRNHCKACRQKNCEERFGREFVEYSWGDCA